MNCASKRSFEPRLPYAYLNLSDKRVTTTLSLRHVAVIKEEEAVRYIPTFCSLNTLIADYETESEM